MIKKKLLKKNRQSAKPETNTLSLHKSDHRSFTPTRGPKQPISTIAEYSNNLINTSCKSLKRKKKSGFKLFVATPQKERKTEQGKNIFKNIEVKNTPAQNKLDPAFQTKRLEKVYRITPSGSPASGRSLALSCRDMRRRSDSNNDIGKIEKFRFMYKEKLVKVSLEYVLEGHRNSVNCLELAHGGLYSASHDYSIKKWKFYQTLPGPYVGREYSQGQVFRNSLNFFRYSRPALFVSVGKYGVFTGFDKCFKVFKDRENSLTIGLDSLFRVYSKYGENFIIGSREIIQKFDMDKMRLFKMTEFKECTALESQNSTFFAGDSRGKISIFDDRSEKAAAGWTGHYDKVGGIRLSQKGVLSCSEDGSIKLWDLRNFKEIHSQKSNGRLAKIMETKYGILTGGDLLRIWTESGPVEFGGRCKDFLFKEGCIISGEEEKIAVWSIQTLCETNEYVSY